MAYAVHWQYHYMWSAVTEVDNHDHRLEYEHIGYTEFVNLTHEQFP